MRATFRIDMTPELYWGPSDHGRLAAARARRVERVQILPALRRHARAPASESHRARTSGVRAMRVRVLSRSKDRCRDDYHYRNRSDRAGAAGDRSRLWQV